jgi:hypothetical protein
LTSAFGFDKKAQGSVYYGREVFLRSALKLEDGDDVAVDGSVLVDFGTKSSAKFGGHHLVKFEARSSLSKQVKKLLLC